MMSSTGNYNSIYYQPRRRTHATLGSANYASYMNDIKSQGSTKNASPTQISLKGANSNIKSPQLQEINSTTNTYTIYPKSYQTSPNSSKNKNAIYVSPYKYIPKPKKEDIDIGDTIGVSSTENNHKQYQKRYFKSALDNYDNIPPTTSNKKEGVKLFGDLKYTKGVVQLPSIIKDQNSTDPEILQYESHQTINIKERVDASYEFFQQVLREVRQNSSFKRNLEQEFNKNSHRRNKTLDTYDKDFDDNGYDYQQKQRENTLSGMKSVRQSRELGDDIFKKPNSKLNPLRSPSSKHKKTKRNKTEITLEDDFEGEMDYQKQVSFQNGSKSTEKRERQFENNYTDNRLDRIQVDLQSDAFSNSFNNTASKSTKNQMMIPQPNSSRTKDEIIEDYKKLLLSKKNSSYTNSRGNTSQQTSPTRISQDRQKSVKNNYYDESNDTTVQTNNPLIENVNLNESNDFYNNKAFKKDLARRYRQIVNHNSTNGNGNEENSETKSKAFDLSHTYYSQKLSLLEKQLSKKKTENEELEYKFDETLTSYKLQTATEQSKYKQKNKMKQNGSPHKDVSTMNSNPKDLQTIQDTISTLGENELKLEVEMKCNSQHIVQQAREGKEIKLDCSLFIKSVDQSQLRRRSTNPIDIIFVIDNIEKVMSEKFSYVQEIISNIVRELEDRDKVCIFVQNSLNEEFEQLRELTTDNRKQLKKILQQIPTATQSQMYSLLLHAFKITSQKLDKTRLSYILAFGDSQNLSVYQKINSNLKKQIQTHNIKQTMRNSQIFQFQNQQQQPIYNQIEESSILTKYFSLEPIPADTNNNNTIPEDVYDISDLVNSSPVRNSQTLKQVNNNNTTQNNNGINQNSNNSKVPQNGQIYNQIQDQKAQQNGLQQPDINGSHQQSTEQRQVDLSSFQKNKQENNKTKQNYLSDIEEQRDEDNLHSSRKYQKDKSKNNALKNHCKDIISQILNIVQVDSLLELRVNPVFSDVFRISQVFNEKYVQDEENSIFIFRNKIIDKTMVKTLKFEIEANRQLFAQIISNSSYNIFEDHSIVEAIFAISSQNIQIKSELYLNLNNPEQQNNSKNNNQN